MSEQHKLQEDMAAKAFKDAVTALFEINDDENSITMAILRFQSFPGEETGAVSLFWQPAMFVRPMPEELRTVIVSKLRQHADMLESGQLDKDMNKMTAKAFAQDGGDSGSN